MISVINRARSLLKLPELNTIQTLLTRGVTALSLCGLFAWSVYENYTVLMITCCQLICLKEIVSLRKHLNWFHIVESYFLFALFQFVLFGNNITSYNIEIGLFCLILLMFLFINELPDPKHPVLVKLKYDDLQHILTSILCAMLGNFHILNANENILWFLLPILYVCVNDSFAYIIGKCVGKRKLHIISPNKTVEGFLGAAIVCIIISFVVNVYSYMFFDYGLITQEFLEPTKYYINEYSFIQVVPIQAHNTMICIFSSFLCPLAGLFASGVKRGYDIKDFGSILPGHGGMTDRVDCISVSGILVYVYFNSSILNSQGVHMLD